MPPVALRNCGWLRDGMRRTQPQTWLQAVRDCVKGRVLGFSASTSQVPVRSSAACLRLHYRNRAFKTILPVELPDAIAMSLVISDTTPLNYLILIGDIDVLPRLFGKLLVPPAVIHEMRHPKAPAAVALWTASLPAWIEVKAPHTDLHLGLGAGEDEAISLAVELRDAAILMDDRKARAESASRSPRRCGRVTG